MVTSARVFFVSVLTALILALTGVAVLSTSEDAGAAGPVARDDAASASALARAGGRPVDVTGLRSETSDTVANPDGTFTFTSYAAPIRVRRGTGWAPIDRTLRRAADGRYTTGATVSDLAFSGGGTGPLATIGKSGRELALRWPAPLPAPRVSGAVATYPEVLPGVDLQVRAEDDGFAELLVVKNRTAAANPALREITFGTTTRGLTLRPEDGGGLSAVDGAGRPVFVSPGAALWDSAGTAPCGADRPTPERTTPVPVRLGAGTMTLSPDQSALTGPDTVYPLCIDPPFNGAADKWTHVRKSQPDTSFWGSFRTSMRVGRVWQGASNDVWRTFVRIDIGGITNIGATIVNAAFFAKLDHSASCGPTSVDLWHTDFVSPTSPPTTWNNTNSFGGATGVWNSSLGVVAANANEEGTPVSQGGCGPVQPDVLMEWNNSLVRTAVQGMAGGTFGIMTFGLKAADETDGSKWKYFYPADSSTPSERSFLTVTYNRKPDVPVLKPLSDCYLACGSPGAVRSTTPALTVGVRDADNPAGAVLKTWFEVYNSAETTLLAGNTSPVMAVSGSSPSWRVTAGALSNGGTYHWRAKVVDELNAESPYSAWGVFTVDTGPPVLPVVSSPQYPEHAWGPGENTVATFSFGPGTATDVAEYTWSIDGFVPPTKVAAAANGTASITWTTRGVVNTLRVFAADPAGNISPTRSYEFWVSPPLSRFSQWTLDETSGTTAADTGKNHVAPAPGTLAGGVAFAPGHVNGGAHFTGTGTIATASAVLDTTRSFSVAAWVRPDAFTGNHTVVAQQATSASLVRLYYRSASQQWCFGIRPTDNPGTEGTFACSAVTPQAGTWTHLVGVYDAAAGTIAVYVDGGPNGDGSVADDDTATGTPPAASGRLTIGAAFASGSSVEFFRGDIDEVVAAQRALGASDIFLLALGGRLP